MPSIWKIKPSQSVVLFVFTFLAILALSSCGPSAAELAAVDYTPLLDGDWQVSTPQEQGLDPQLVAKLYLEAEEVETIRSLLVVKDGYLIAEKYFHGGGMDEKERLQSVTKSFTSALVGIALEEGCLTSVDQKMLEFFPELADKVKDPRKSQITIRQMLEMRAGYPWEESTPELFEMLYAGFRPSLLVDVPLVYDPGTDFDYSNLTSHLLGIVVARACNTDLKTLAQEHLFTPMNIEMGDWIQDWEGYYNGHADLHLTARDMAKFGQLYLNDGEYQGQQLVPAEWVRESLQTYTQDAWDYKVGRNVKEMGYGYQWWSVQTPTNQYYMAWGHGGQQIALVRELNMIVVVTADPLFGQHGDKPWRLEKQNLNLVANFVSSLSGE
jgi:CubicO group peptidase (beta-lactamase class C family)